MKNNLKHVYLLILCFILCCTSNETKNKNEQRFEVLALKYLVKDILTDPSNYDAINNLTYFKDYFEELDLKTHKLFVSDSICNWSGQLTNVPPPSYNETPPFECYSLIPDQSLDYEICSSYDQFMNVSVDAYLLILSKPVKYEWGEHIRINLYPNKSDEFESLCFDIVQRDHKMDLHSVCIQ